MKKFIITEEEKSRILNMHKSISANHYLMEQGSLGAFSGGTFSGGTPMDKEIIALEELKTQLEKTKKELEFKKQVVGGTTIDRIRNYFRIRKIRKENQTLEIETYEGNKFSVSHVSTYNLQLLFYNSYNSNDLLNEFKQSWVISHKLIIL